MSIFEKKRNVRYGQRISGFLFTLMVVLITMPLGLFLIGLGLVGESVSREEAVAYVGRLDHYESSEDYCGINFADGSYYSIYPRAASDTFHKRMQSLAKGTQLYVLVNPHNDYVLEAWTATEELLNFKSTQRLAKADDRAVIVLGSVVCGSGALLTIFGFVTLKSGQNAKKRYAQKRTAGETVPLRYADETVKSRTLLEARFETYRICYRRVKNVNELVVNGRVYDEYKGILEFEHHLLAMVDGHVIEAGYDADGYSYIQFDGELLEQKKRYW